MMSASYSFNWLSSKYISICFSYTNYYELQDNILVDLQEVLSPKPLFFAVVWLETFKPCLVTRIANTHDTEMSERMMISMCYLETTPKHYFKPSRKVRIILPEGWNERVIFYPSHNILPKSQSHTNTNSTTSTSFYNFLTSTPTQDLPNEILVSTLKAQFHVKTCCSHRVSHSALNQQG